MSDPSQMSMFGIWQDTSPVTSSPASADGPSPSASPAGPTTGPCGPDRRPASLSVPQDSAAPQPTNDTSPPLFSSWSGPPAPQCCLASRSPARRSSERLQAALNEALPTRVSGHGSTIYRMVWKRQATPSGRLIYRLRASARRTSDSDSSSPQSELTSPRWPLAQDGERSGWPTACATEPEQGCGHQRHKKTRAQRGGGSAPNLATTAQIAGWPSPSARDWKDSPGMATAARNPDGSARDRTDQLPRKAMLAGWATPMTNDTEGAASPEAVKTWASRGHNLPEQTQIAHDGPARLTTRGEMLTGSGAGMESGGRLDPDHSRWLLGFPPAWCACAATATPSSRRSRRNSSAHSRQQQRSTECENGNHEDQV